MTELEELKAARKAARKAAVYDAYAAELKKTEE